MRHPTLELRATDCCTKLDDAIAIASLYRALARYLFGGLGTRKAVTVLDRAIADENKWRAQRYGVDCTFVTDSGPMPLADFLDRVIDMVSEDAEHLKCRSEVELCKAIARSGSSADHQLRAGVSEDDAAEAAKHYIAQATLEFL
jgi:carboxylate-amine ligase